MKSAFCNKKLRSVDLLMLKTLSFSFLENKTFMFGINKNITKVYLGFIIVLAVQPKRSQFDHVALQI